MRAWSIIGCAVAFGAALLVARDGIVAGGIVRPPPAKAPPPPPPSPPEQRRPATPMRIRVGGQVQSSYIGPGSRWLLAGSAEGTALAVSAVQANPNDVCARGALIAAGRDRPEHLVWMIDHNPEWDGFLVGPAFYYGVTDTGVRNAWLRQVIPNQPSARILHNAAMYFAGSDPGRAEELLREAIAIDPGEAFYRERLGEVYGLGLCGVRREGNRPFAQRALLELIRTRDAAVLFGAKSRGASCLNSMPWGQFFESLHRRVPRIEWIHRPSFAAHLNRTSICDATAYRR